MERNCSNGEQPLFQANFHIIESTDFLSFLPAPLHNLTNCERDLIQGFERRGWLFRTNGRGGGVVCGGGGGPPQSAGCLHPGEKTSPEVPEAAPRAPRRQRLCGAGRRGGGALHSTTASAGKRRPICDPPADVRSSMCPAGLARVPGSELGLALPLLLPAKNPAAACAADSAAWWQGTGPSSKGSWRSGPRPARPPDPRPPLSSHVPTRPSAPGRQPSPVTMWH